MNDGVREKFAQAIAIMREVCDEAERTIRSNQYKAAIRAGEDEETDDD